VTPGTGRRSPLTVSPEELVFGGPAELTEAEVARRAGVDVLSARLTWRAMGFSDVGPGVAAFTHADVAALLDLRHLVEAGLVLPDEQLGMVRAVAHALARLASWQVGLVGSAVARGAVADPDALAAEVLPISERLLVHVWRRHLVATAHRALTLPGDDSATRTTAVGFVDLVGFTGLTRSVDDAALGAIVDRFESRASDVVAGHGGRVVKTIGDEVLFVTDEATAGAETALDLATELTGDEALPSVRVGAAYGPVLDRLGDVYGPVVNIASRLTAVAHPGTVLVDRGLADALAAHPAYRLHRLRPVAVRGYEHLQPTVLRRAATDPDSLDG